MIIDLDSHIREQYFLDEVYSLAEPFSRFTPVKINDGKYQTARFRHNLDVFDPKVRAIFNHLYMSDPKLKWRGGEYADRQAGGYDMERKLKDMEIEGVDKTLIFPTQMQIPTMNYGALGAALCRAYNDWVAKLVRGHEDRLWPVAMMPAGCPDEMPRELRRCVRDLGFKAAHLVPYCGARNLNDPVFFSFYQTAVELNVPLFCHPNSNGVLADRFDSFFAMHVMGRPSNCTTGLVALICGGIFELFPQLRVAFFECSAEWIVYWMHRMDDDYEAYKDFEAKNLTLKPSEYIRRNCYLTCEVDEKYLAMAIDEIGAERICFATDYPHSDSEFPHTVTKLQERSDLTSRQKELLLGENAARLLNV